MTCFGMVYFDSLFSGCINLDGIPQDLFLNNKNAASFQSTFYGTGITSVPAGLFRNNKKATTFTSVFAYCSKLVSVGNGVFNDTSVGSINRAFIGCKLMSSNLNSIFNMTSYARVADAAYAFYDCQSMTGKGLEFISAVPNVNIPGGESNAFYNCKNLTDYNQIPIKWGGGGT